ncbi:protein ORANGE-LIKE, chloroplastic isoform X2 [Beta vulgaris subsp. vulgaris]|uniref:protein ORANGE-LIKE, chloroplastic isoform X2 n=1 Tax=Beta vulgaris subsp. vulgaris TaxID=3555 RepID=UPI0020370A09|nr:protein ORANGE-LIKE, chloroplastic isoform X2 [Beta vulgaris subsp. vulgaris]
MECCLFLQPSSFITIPLKGKLKRHYFPNSKLLRVACSSSSKDSFDSLPVPDNSSGNFCIIEGPETVQNFTQMQTQEIQDNIRSRRNKIFLLMEEVRRLRIQQRLKRMKGSHEGTSDEANEMPEIPSSIPFLPHVLELKLGLGGMSYEDFIRTLHLPLQLSQVDPIVASFSGGAVGVISALMLIEVNNVEQQEKKRCKYCHGSGYLACARCSASGVCLRTEPISISSDFDRPLRVPTTQRCSSCSGAGKVMCPTCLCTGMIMASEHDLRIDPFD